jgi:hypothetical protein
MLQVVPTKYRRFALNFKASGVKFFGFEKNVEVLFFRFELHILLKQTTF